MKYKKIDVEIDDEKYNVALLLTKEELHALFDHIGGTSIMDRRLHWGISEKHNRTLSGMYQSIRKASRDGETDILKEKLFPQVGP